MHKVHTTIITLLCFSSYRHVIREFVSFDDISLEVNQAREGSQMELSI
jgi:hypothetical protein